MIAAIIKRVLSNQLVPLCLATVVYPTISGQDRPQARRHLSRIRSLPVAWQQRAAGGWPVKRHAG